MASQEEYEGEEQGEDEYVELDLEKTLTWTGNAVSIQAGGEFRLPLIVPHPSVLAIQFEVEGGYDIEFSLTFQDDHEEGSSTLVEPVRVADREGQLDIDTTGVCELVWSNHHAWMSSKVLSYQLQLAPKVNTQMRKYRMAVISAADDYRVLAAAEAADQVDRAARTLKTRTAQVESELQSCREKSEDASLKHERYLSHVKRLEEEVAAAKAHAEQAKADLAATKRETAQMERRLTTMQNIRALDEEIDGPMLSTISKADEPLELLFEAYAGSMYPQEAEGETGGAGSSDADLLKIDRAEFIHLLQDFEILGRAEPPDEMCGVFAGCGQSLKPDEFKRCVGRAALALAPAELPGDGPLETGDSKLRWMLLQLPLRIESTKLPVLDVQRRVRVLAAAEHLGLLMSGSP